MKFRCLAVFGLAVALCIPCLAAETVSIRGMVVDPEGNPVSGVGVTALFHASGVLTVSVKGDCVSDGDGRFELPALPRLKQREMYILVAFKPGEYLGWTYEMGGLGGSETASPAPAEGYAITVSKLGVFEGKVGAADGTPIPDATITLGALRDARSGQYMAAGVLDPLVKYGTTTSDGDGVFRIQGVPAHTHAICFARKPGCVMSATDERSMDPKRIVLVPAGTIAGAVVDARGKGVAGVELHAREESSGRGSGFAKTKTDGSYVIDGLLPGSYYVKVWEAKDVVAKPVDDILVKAGQTTKVRRMVVTSGALLQIRVVDVETGKPIPGGYVSANIPAASESTSTNGGMDSRGRCTLRLVPGEYQVYFYGDSATRKYQPKTARGITIPAAGVKNLVIKLKKSDIARGKVVDSSGRPLAGASVSVGSPWDSKTTTDASGRFSAIVPPARPSTPG